jgi:hypothetical protein
MKISRKPTPPPRPTAPSRPSKLVTADTALARVADSLLASRTIAWIAGPRPNEGPATRLSSLAPRGHGGPQLAPIHPRWGCDCFAPF